MLFQKLGESELAQIVRLMLGATERRLAAREAVQGAGGVGEIASVRRLQVFGRAQRGARPAAEFAGSSSVGGACTTSTPTAVRFTSKHSAPSPIAKPISPSTTIAEGSNATSYAPVGRGIRSVTSATIASPVTSDGAALSTSTTTASAPSGTTSTRLVSTGGSISFASGGHSRSWTTAVSPAVGSGTTCSRSKNSDQKQAM